MTLVDKKKRKPGGLSFPFLPLAGAAGAMGLGGGMAAAGAAAPLADKVMQYDPGLLRVVNEGREANRTAHSAFDTGLNYTRYGSDLLSHKAYGDLTALDIMRMSRSVDPEKQWWYKALGIQGEWLPDNWVPKHYGGFGASQQSAINTLIDEDFTGGSIHNRLNELLVGHNRLKVNEPDVNGPTSKDPKAQLPANIGYLANDPAAAHMGKFPLTALDKYLDFDNPKRESLLFKGNPLKGKFGGNLYEKALPYLQSFERKGLATTAGAIGQYPAQKVRSQHYQTLSDIYSQLGDLGKDDNTQKLNLVEKLLTTDSGPEVEAARKAITEARHVEAGQGGKFGKFKKLPVSPAVAAAVEKAIATMPGSLKGKVDAAVKGVNSKFLGRIRPGPGGAGIAFGPAAAMTVPQSAAKAEAIREAFVNDPKAHLAMLSSHVQKPAPLGPVFSVYGNIAELGAAPGAFARQVAKMAPTVKNVGLGLAGAGGVYGGYKLLKYLWDQRRFNQELGERRKSDDDK